MRRRSRCCTTRARRSGRTDPVCQVLDPVHSIVYIARLDVSRDTLFGPTAAFLWGRLPSRTSCLREEDGGTRGEVTSRFRLGSKKILRYVASTAGPLRKARAGRRPSGL